nr:hypothetical protein GCM10020093_090940 [Planobispora longispora]
MYAVTCIYRAGPESFTGAATVIASPTLRLRRAVVIRGLPILCVSALRAGILVPTTAKAEAGMAELGLAETVRALREELEAAVAGSGDQEIRFQVGQVQLEFHVGVRREGG